MHKWLNLALTLFLAVSLTACDAMNKEDNRGVEKERQDQETVEQKQEIIRAIKIRIQLDKALVEKDYEKALPLARESWELCKKIFGLDSSLTKEAKERLDTLEHHAKELQLKALEERLRILLHQKKFAEMLPIMEQKYQLLCELLGADHEEAKRLGKALEKLRRLWAMQKQAPSSFAKPENAVVSDKNGNRLAQKMEELLCTRTF